MTVEELLEIEQIRTLRNRYAATFESGDVAGFTELFCDDAVCEFPEEFGGSWVGRDTIAGNFAEQAKTVNEPLDAIHVTTNPWITLTGPDTAHGRCYLLDLRGQLNSGDERVSKGDENPLRSLGMCEDDYRKVDGVWKFAKIRLPFFWADRAAENLD